MSSISANPFYMVDAADISGSTALSGYSGLAMTVGGVACNQDGMKVLLSNQVDPLENGPKVVRSGAWENLDPNTTPEVPLLLVTGGYNAGMWFPNVVDWSAGSGSTWSVRRFHAPGSIYLTGASAAPAGWLLCDGAAVLRAGYPTLFAAIGTTYGAGDTTTTFNLPDLRQRFPLGKAASGTGATLGGVGGNIDHAHGSLLTTGAPSATVQATNLTGSAASPTHTHAVTVPADNPPYQVVNYIIKV